MFYYAFSVVNTMSVPCTALLYNSTAATRTLKLSTTLLSISCGIRLISFLMMSSLVSGLLSQTVFEVPPQKIVRRVEILGIGWLGFTGFAWNVSVPWEVMPEVLKCSVVAPDFSDRSEHLNTSGITSHLKDSFHVRPITPGHPIPKISTCLTIFCGGT